MTTRRRFLRGIAGTSAALAAGVPAFAARATARTGAVSERRTTDESERRTGAVRDSLSPNPWLERRVLNFAHQGGALEAPSDTPFALQTAREKGADVLEIDVHATADGEVVAIHDTTVDRTTDGAGRVDEHTLAELKELDAAYWFVPGCGACHDRPDDDYPYRGYATGDEELTPGVAHRNGLDSLVPDDFRVPTLRQILEEFPDAFLNVEIKRTAPRTEPYEAEVARLLREYDRTDDAIVVSFHERAIEAFKAHAPAVDTAVATGQAGAFTASSRGPAPGAPNPRYVALQVPIEFEGVRVVTGDFVRDAHENGLAVHVWTIDDRETMEWLLDAGVDGIMTDRPTLLEEVLDDRETNDERGTDHDSLRGR